MIYVFFLFVFKRSFQNSLEFYINKNFTSTTGSAASLDKTQMYLGLFFSNTWRGEERKGKESRGGEERGGEVGRDGGKYSVTRQVP